MRLESTKTWLAALLLVLLAWPLDSALAVPVMPGGPDYGWLFDDGSGVTGVASHGGQDATLVNGTAWSASTPFGYAGNQALSLDGVDDFVEVASLNNLALDGASAFTISLWVQADSTSADRAFFGGTDPGNADAFGGRYDQNGWLNGNSASELLKFGIEIDRTNYQYESSSGYQQTSWQHILFTWESGSGARLYVDGVLDTPSEISAGLGTLVGVVTGQNRFLIGDGAKANWAGELDEFMLWRTALSGDNAEWLAANSGFALPNPEPGTALLFGLGLIGLALRARR